MALGLGHKCVKQATQFSPPHGFPSCKLLYDSEVRSVTEEVEASKKTIKNALNQMWGQGVGWQGHYEFLATKNLEEDVQAHQVKQEWKRWAMVVATTIMMNSGPHGGKM